jgi:hypothetical protein
LGRPDLAVEALSGSWAGGGRLFVVEARFR